MVTPNHPADAVTRYRAAAALARNGDTESRMAQRIGSGVERKSIRGPFAGALKDILEVARFQQPMRFRKGVASRSQYGHATLRRSVEPAPSRDAD